MIDVMETIKEFVVRYGGESFDMRYHARNNQAAAKRDRIQACIVCGWSERMAIHDHGNIGSCFKGWAHTYEPQLK